MPWRRINDVHVQLLRRRGPRTRWPPWLIPMHLLCLVLPLEDWATWVVWAASVSGTQE